MKSIKSKLMILTLSLLMTLIHACGSVETDSSNSWPQTATVDFHSVYPNGASASSSTTIDRVDTSKPFAVEGVYPL